MTQFRWYSPSLGKLLNLALFDHDGRKCSLLDTHGTHFTMKGVSVAFATIPVYTCGPGCARSCRWTHKKLTLSSWRKYRKERSNVIVRGLKNLDNPLFALPPELLLDICDFLTVADIVTFRTASRHLYQSELLAKVQRDRTREQNEFLAMSFSAEAAKLVRSLECTCRGPAMERIVSQCRKKRIRDEYHRQATKELEMPRAQRLKLDNLVCSACWHTHPRDLFTKYAAEEWPFKRKCIGILGELRIGPEETLTFDDLEYSTRPSLDFVPTAAPWRRNASPMLKEPNSYIVYRYPNTRKYSIAIQFELNILGSGGDLQSSEIRNCLEKKQGKYYICPHVKGASALSCRRSDYWPHPSRHPKHKYQSKPSEFLEREWWGKRAFECDKCDTRFFVEEQATLGKMLFHTVELTVYREIGEMVDPCDEQWVRQLEPNPIPATLGTIFEFVKTHA